MKRLLIAALFFAASSPCFSQPYGAVASTVVSGTTSGTANTFTTVLAQNSVRKGCLIQNTSTSTEYIYIGSGSATEAASYTIAPNSSFSCTASGLVIGDQVQIACSGASCAYSGSVQ